MYSFLLLLENIIILIKFFYEFIATGFIQICISEAVLLEYKNVSKREKFNKYSGFEQRALELIQSIEEVGLWFVPDNVISRISDEPDNRFLELAVTAQSFCIVTGNSNDFDFHEYNGVKILTPQAFYELVISDILH